MVRQATERNFEIIGKAVNNILKIKPDILIESARRIVGLRNRLIHAYDAIDDANIWAIIVNHLPVLKKEVIDLLKTK
ncbi:MAG: HepT-like ribonuclease domain-containing protein [Bacteroidota bacterium]|nr:HepT-like ribonuclease domain-containing protein [Bacteroidota bacterium]